MTLPTYSRVFTPSGRYRVLRGKKVIAESLRTPQDCDHAERKDRALLDLLAALACPTFQEGRRANLPSLWVTCRRWLRTGHPSLTAHERYATLRKAFGSKFGVLVDHRQMSFYDGPADGSSAAPSP